MDQKKTITTPPPSPVPAESNIGVTTGLRLTAAGVGLVLAIAGGAADYVQTSNLPDFVSSLPGQFAKLKGELQQMVPDATSSDKIVLPKANIPGSPTAPLKVPEETQFSAPGKPAPVQGIYEKILGNSQPPDSSGVKEAVPVPKAKEESPSSKDTERPATPAEVKPTASEKPAPAPDDGNGGDDEENFVVR